MKKHIIVIALLLTVILTGCGSSTEKVTVLTNSGYEPYEMVDTSGNLTGFDIELMEALAEEIGIEIEWKDVAFDGIIASLQSEQYEIAIAGISPTDERKAMVDFGDIYYNAEAGLTNYLVFDASKAYTSLDDLDGLIVGSQLGTVQATLLDSIKAEYNFTLDLRNTNTQIVEEIKAGRIDVLVVESLIADSIIEANPELSKVGFESSLDDSTGTAITFMKGSIYTEQFNVALQTIKDNGTLQELINKWFE